MLGTKPSRLLVLAAFMALLYAGLAALYPLQAGLLNPRKTWAQQVDASPLVGIAHALIYVGLFVAYGAAVRWLIRVGTEASTNRLKSSNTSPPFAVVIIASGSLFSFILLFSFPGESVDVFDYLFRGRMITEYGLSPLAHTPSEIKNMPFHRYLSWSAWVDAYGPVWEYASAGVSWGVKQVALPAELLVKINQTCAIQPAVCTLVTKYITTYRLLAIGLTGIGGALIYAIVERRASHLALAALAIWLWNPLVIVSTAIGAHNDVLMLVFVLAALALFQRQHGLLGLLALIAAAHVKMTALILLPVFCIWLVRQVGVVRTLQTTLAAVAIAAPFSYLLYAPLGGWVTLPRNLYERTLLSANSLAELGYLFLREGMDWSRPVAQRLASRTATIAFAVLAGVLLWRLAFGRPNDDERADSTRLWRSSLLVVLAYFAIGSFWFQPWYLAWLVALAALMPTARFSRIVLPVYGLSALLAATLSDYLRASEALPGWAISAVTVTVLFLPAAITWATTTLRRGQEEQITSISQTSPMVRSDSAVVRPRPPE